MSFWAILRNQFLWLFNIRVPGVRVAVIAALLLALHETKMKRRRESAQGLTEDRLELHIRHNGSVNALIGYFIVCAFSG